MITGLEGGPLKHKYEVAQLHLHWGQTDSTGSEHRIDGRMYAAEVSPPAAAAGEEEEEKRKRKKEILDEENEEEEKYWKRKMRKIET